MSARRVQCPREFAPGWRQQFRSAVGTGPGVYLAYRDDKLLYVGKSSCLAKRLMYHALNWMSTNEECYPTHFELIDTENSEGASELEAELIRSQKPLLNRRMETGRPAGSSPPTNGRRVYGRYAIVQQRTGAMDGWYMFRDDAIEMLKYWRREYPQDEFLVVAAKQSKQFFPARPALRTPPVASAAGRGASCEEAPAFEIAN